MEAGDETPVIENRQLVEKEETLGVKVPGVRGVVESEVMSQSYHEIFDTQGYLGGEGTLSDEPEHQVYYSEGEGRLVCEEDTGSTTQYLTSKLVADSLMWQQTFRNDSPSPVEESRPAPPSVESAATKNDPDRAARSPPAGLESDLARLEVSRSARLLDHQVINDVEREARRLATEVDTLVEHLSCTLQSVSALTVDTVETYRDGVVRTCDEVDSNIRGMYQLMAKWEELNKNMAPAYRVSGQIKDIKRLLDMFEAALG